MAARPAADSAWNGVERPTAPLEPRASRPSPGADRAGPSLFHDVDRGEDVDCSPPFSERALLACRRPAARSAETQPLTEPAASPSTIQRWMNMYRATTGTVVITDAAINWPQWKTSP